MQTETEDIELKDPSADVVGRFPRSMKIAVVVAVAVLLAGGGYYVYNRFYNNPQAQARREAERIVAAVGKLIMLPTDEQPIIATVADPTQLADQPFFKNASKGDKVLIYNQAKKAYLYSPSFNKVVDVAPLSGGSPTPAPKK